jgi:hypothetical protein
VQERTIGCRMKDIAVIGMSQCADLRLLIVRTHVQRPVNLVLCSRTTGRDRWYVDALKDRPRLAAAVELVLRTEDGIQDVRANPLTGRVLVCYDPAVVPAESVENLIDRAIGFGPMSREEFALLGVSRSDYWSLSSLVAAELVCCLFPMLALGGICSLGRNAAVAFFLVRRTGQKRRCEQRHGHGRLVMDQA